MGHLFGAAFNKAAPFFYLCSKLSSPMISARETSNEIYN